MAKKQEIESLETTRSEKKLTGKFATFFKCLLKAFRPCRKKCKNKQPGEKD